MLKPVILSLMFSVMGLGADAPPSLPKVMLTRVFEHGGAESLSLRCAPDLKGSQEFFCEIVRFRNGVEVATTSLYAKQTKQILDSFFTLLPPGHKPMAGEPETASSPSYIWEVTYNDKIEKGFKPRGRKSQESESRVMRAVLSLEGALASQFYR